MNALRGWMAVPECTEQYSATTNSQNEWKTHPCELQGQNWAATAPNIAKGPCGLVAMVLGKIRWSRDDLAEQARRDGDAATLVEFFESHDRQVLKYVGGSFSCVVLDPTAVRVFAAVDRIGQVPLYYATSASGLVFGSDAGSVAEHPAIDRKLSLQAIYNYMYFHMIPSPGSIYEGIAKLAGANWLDFRNGHIEIGTYWMPKFIETKSANLRELGARMLEIIEQSVDEAARNRKVGAFLSGGLDSSTVSGMLAKQSIGSADTYSIGFAVEGYDEIAYARIAASHFRTRQHEYYVTPDDVVEVIPRIAAACDEPFGNSSAIPAYCCARLAAADGIGCLLAGDGGDELFAGNARYAKQKLFELYSQTPNPIRSTFEPMLFRFPSIGPIAKIQSYVRQAKIALPDRLETYNFLHRLEPIEMFEDDVLSVIDRNEPLRLQRDRYAAPDNASALNRMMYLDWQQTLADNDLRKVGIACRLAGVQVAYPLLDDTLIDFSCSIPSALKLPRQRLRHFYKEAMLGFLPNAIIEKSKHGFGLPFGIWMHTHKPLQSLAYDSLEMLKSRHLFRNAFIDQTIALHRSEHASYYGELIWLLMMLELWLMSHNLHR